MSRKNDKREPYQMLEDAISSGNPQEVKAAIAAGAGVIHGRSLHDPTGEGSWEHNEKIYTPINNLLPPLIAAAKGPSAEVMDILIRNVIDKSQVFTPWWKFRKKTPDPARTQKALEDHLYNEWKSGHLLQHAARNPAKNMLATVWPYYKGNIAYYGGKGDINQRFDNEESMIHAAAGVLENLTYLLKEGADINIATKDGLTPLMKMVLLPHRGLSVNIERDTEALLTFYDKHGADFHAKDHKGRNVIFYALQPDEKGIIHTSQIVCFKYALKKGINPFVFDNKGKTAIDRFVKFSDIKAEPRIFRELAEYGYNAPALIRKYHNAFTTIGALKDTARLFDLDRQQVCSQMGEVDVLEKLWKKDGSPSELLIKACGYEALGALFEQPALKQDPDRARALYNEMVQKLPSQCQEYLRTGVDISVFQRETEPPRRPAALDKALRRKSAPGESGKDRLPGRQP